MFGSAFFGLLFLILILTISVIGIIVLSIGQKELPAETRKRNKEWKIAFVIVILIPILLFLIHYIFFTPMIVDRSDNYGEYVIDRDVFKGKQADWQYNHYRFEIKEDNTFLFYVTEKEKIIKTYKGTVTFIAPRGKSVCIFIDMNEPRHHILEQHPTMYRNIWSFYYVFKSKYYGNMFFRKGTWKEIKE